MADVRPVMLLDVDGVLLDIGMQMAEWDRLADHVFEPLLGARDGGWAALQRGAWLDTSRRISNALWKLDAAQRPPPSSFWNELLEQWITQLCASAELNAPATVEDRALLGQRALAGYARNSRAVVSAAAETIASLSQRFELHMASGNPAFVVESVLEGIGVRELVGFPFGSDLASAYKEESARFYTSICERLGVNPEHVWVVDDRDTHLAAARALGAKTIKIGPASNARHDLVLPQLSALPAALERGP
jgi:FMN phosphatase YigB (HAD superfamily)